ncbi:MAG: hypothetical protein ACXWTY_06465 [Methylobacter sp.]
MRKQFPLNAKPVKAPPWIDSRLEAFRELAQWLKDEKIAATFYLNPLHPFVAKAYGTERLAEFKEKIEVLSGQGGLRDCTEELNGNALNEHFYDYKHFRPEAANIITRCGLAN